MRSRWVLYITPESHLRATKGDSIFFRIPREKLHPAGLKRLLRLERYNNYKVNLLAEAKKRGFELSPAGMSITFFIPCPKSWSQKKKEQHHGMLHQARPDIDNLAKAFFDSIVTEDKFVANVTFTKRWVFYEKGWILIELNKRISNKAMIELPHKYDV